MERATASQPIGNFHPVYRMYLASDGHSTQVPDGNFERFIVFCDLDRQSVAIGEGQ